MRLFLALLLFSNLAVAQTRDLTLAREKNYLVIQGPHLPKGEIRINYLEAYCRPNSTTADWHDTTIGHTTELISLSADKKTMKLRCSVKDGVIVNHTITATSFDGRKASPYACDALPAAETVVPRG